MIPTRNTWLPMLAGALLLSACASTPIPLAISCPEPPPIPESLKPEPALISEPLTTRYERLLQELRLSLERARR